MKVGDILTCIKTISDSSHNQLFTKNNSYIIYEIHSSNWGEIHYHIMDNWGNTGPAFYYNMIKKYFISQKELRKQKLKKIYNV